MAGFVEVFSKSKILGEVVLIFLTVGNWHKGFDRLVKAVDELKAAGIITEEVIAQIGPGKYRPTNLEAIDYCSPEEFVRNINKARIIIAHAGMGTIAQATRLKKAVVVVPRKAELGEHFDDHQFATARQFEAEGWIIVAYEVPDLPIKIIQAKTFIPVQGQSSREILKVVQEFIDDAITGKDSSSSCSEQRS